MEPQRNLPDFGGEVVLDSAENKTLYKQMIVPAAVYFWGRNYGRVENYAGNDDIFTENQSPSGDEKVRLSFYLSTDEFADEEYICLNIDMQSYRADLTDLLPLGLRNYEIWETTNYEFPTNGEALEADNLYSFIHKKNGEVNDLSDEMLKFLDAINENDLYNRNRSCELKHQDRIDIYNILLELGVPEEILSLELETEE